METTQPACEWKLTVDELEDALESVSQRHLLTTWRRGPQFRADEMQETRLSCLRNKLAKMLEGT